LKRLNRTRKDITDKVSAQIASQRESFAIEMRDARAALQQEQDNKRVTFEREVSDMKMATQTEVASLRATAEKEALAKTSEATERSRELIEAARDTNL
jgi:hypothetical protein